MKNKWLIISGLILALFVGYFLGNLVGSPVVPTETSEETSDGSTEISTENTQSILRKANHLKGFIQENFLFEADEQKMNDGMLKGIFESLEDPYSQYLNQDEFTSLMEDNAGSFGGIGVTVSPDTEDNTITVVAPIKNTPGEKAGIRPGDKIIRINGEEFTGEQMDQAVKIMRGEPGTDVTITILRYSNEKAPEEFELTITREMINIISAEGQMLEDNIGYIHIASFDENTDKYYTEAKEQLLDEGAEGMIIDLRNNPGGLLDTVLSISDRLLPEGPLLFTKNKKGDEIEESSDAKMDEFPIVVLVNEGSASASEIMSGAIQDYERGPIIGTTTFGKGIVQTIIPLGDGTGFKLTVSEYFTPKHRQIHEIGVVPDIQVENAEGDFNFGPEYLETDKQLQRGIEELQKEMTN